MTVFILSVAGLFLIDAAVVGVAFFALRQRLGWRISPRWSFALLWVIFGLLANFLLPMAVVLDATFTVRNPEVARAMDLRPEEPFVGLFGVGALEFMMWAAQAFLASLIGHRLFGGERPVRP